MKLQALTMVIKIGQLKFILLLISSGLISTQLQAGVNFEIKNSNQGHRGPLKVEASQEGKPVKLTFWKDEKYILIDKAATGSIDVKKNLYLTISPMRSYKESHKMNSGDWQPDFTKKYLIKAAPETKKVFLTFTNDELRPQKGVIGISTTGSLLYGNVKPELIEHVQ